MFMCIKNVNGSNYYNEKSLEEMIDLLEQGMKISIYIDCIGHTRTIMEEANYVDALKERYGNRLVKSIEGHWTNYYYLDKVQ